MNAVSSKSQIIKVCVYRQLECLKKDVVTNLTYKHHAIFILPCQALLTSSSSFAVLGGPHQALQVSVPRVLIYRNID